MKRIQVLLPLMLMIVAAGMTTACSGSGSGDPTISAVTPGNGPTTGGTRVTIVGTNLRNTNSVTFGGAAATSVNAVSETSVTCLTPPSAASGLVDVVLTTPGGSVTSPDSFTYIAPW